MNNGKTPNKKYQDYLIDSLLDPAAAAAYLTAILEEPNPEAGLLADALQDVAIAVGMSAAQAQALAESPVVSIESLAASLVNLGFQLVVAPIPANSNHRESVVIEPERVPSSV
jgi:DNA-binding phage protein